MLHPSGPCDRSGPGFCTVFVDGRTASKKKFNQSTLSPAACPSQGRRMQQIIANIQPWRVARPFGFMRTHLNPDTEGAPSVLRSMQEGWDGKSSGFRIDPRKRPSNQRIHVRHDSLASERSRNPGADLQTPERTNLNQVQSESTPGASWRPIPTHADNFPRPAPGFNS
jgi:hypothetical protein